MKEASTRRHEVFFDFLLLIRCSCTLFPTDPALAGGWWMAGRIYARRSTRERGPVPSMDSASEQRLYLVDYVWSHKHGSNAGDKKRRRARSGCAVFFLVSEINMAHGCVVETMCSIAHGCFMETLCCIAGGCFVENVC